MRMRTVLLAVLAAGLVAVPPLAGPAGSQAIDPPRPGPRDKARAEAAGRQAESAGVSIARAHVGAVPQQFATLRVFATQYNPTTPGSVEVAVPDKCVKFAALGNQAILNQFGCPQPGYQIGRDYRVLIFRDNGRSGAIPVKEVGPWNIDDNYWDFGPGGSPRPRRLFRDLEYGLPESQAAFERDYNFKPCLNLDRTPSGRSDGADQFDRCVLNPAGIDLSVAAAAQLGIAPLQNEWVTALFLWEPVRNTITSVRSNQNVDVAGVSQADGAPVIQWPGNGGANQQWRFEGVAPNTYRIVAVHSGKVLDVEGASTADGARVIQWPWHGGTNQQWRFEGVGPGEYRIVSVRSGKVLDVAGESLANGAPIIQWPYHGRTNQRWRLTIVGNG
ncbi:MAG TPA: RICIN domain-containing protein [Acidimicrobiales bacterium]|nr:RICIN domain-containing protein [Acidimicrobiales bacterium]